MSDTTLPYTLYFGPRCTHCNKLMSMLNDSVKSTMTMVDVSKGGVPDYVKSVPTLVTSSKQIYTGAKVFQWVNDHQTREIEGLSSDYGCLIDSDTGPVSNPNFCFISENGFIQPEDYSSRSIKHAQQERPKGDPRLERMMQERASLK